MVKNVTISIQNPFHAFFRNYLLKEKNTHAASTRTLPNQAVAKKAVLSCNETDKTKAKIYWALNV